MTAYAIAHIGPGNGPLHEDVLQYIERIQGTLTPYGGRFLVHFEEHELLEGEWHGAPVLISFPDMAEARDWYASAAYQEIVPLRTRHLPGDIILVDGVPEGYDPAGTAAHVRAAQA
ncbi:DUF1330 domain-containing protein [Streptomyces sp. NPDC004111]|uniref:DUF1330 domain-containing protein n=1 Tax=Streptomyces sp. NPDC004111 TaxID=3364690 RepID=UPI00369C3E8C